MAGSEIYKIRQTKQLTSLSEKNTANLKEILGEKFFENVQTDKEALGMLFNLYDVHNEYFRGYTVNMLQMAIESHNRICLVVLEGMREAFGNVDTAINHSFQEQQEKVNHRKQLIKLAVHLAVSIPLSIAGIPANAFIEQLTNTTGTSSFGNVPTVEGNKLDFDWARDVDIWKTAKEEYAGAFLKGVVGEFQAQITNMSKNLLFKLTGEATLNSMAQSSDSSHAVFERLLYEVKRNSSQLKTELVERLERKATRTQFKDFVVDDLKYLFGDVLKVTPSSDTFIFKSNYYLAQAWSRRVMRSRTKLLKSTLLRQTNVDEAKQQIYTKVLSKLALLYWIGNTDVKTMNASLCNCLVNLELVSGIHKIDLNQIKKPVFQSQIPSTKTDLKNLRTRQKWHDKRIITPKNYHELNLTGKHKLISLVSQNETQIAKGLEDALKMINSAGDMDIEQIDNALSMLGLVTYTDSKEQVSMGLISTPSEATKKGIPTAVQSKEIKPFIVGSISILLRLWLQGAMTPVLTLVDGRAQKPSQIPFMRAQLRNEPSAIIQEKSYFGYIEIPTDNTGDCFFDSIIKSIKAQFPDKVFEHDITNLRQACSAEYESFIKKNIGLCHGFDLDTSQKRIDEIKELIRTAGQWDFREFDLIVGCIMPQIIGRQIITIETNTGNQWITGVQLDAFMSDPNATPLPVYVSYNGRDHYIGLKPPSEEEVLENQEDQIEEGKTAKQEAKNGTNNSAPTMRIRRLPSMTKRPGITKKIKVVKKK